MMQHSEIDQYQPHSNDNMHNHTVYVAPIMHFMSDKVKSYFEQYGDVEVVDFFNKSGCRYQCAHVQFKKTEDAKTVLLIESHLIGNWVVKVKAVDTWQQLEYFQNTFNDDCLREVFQLLNVKDLTNAAEVCIRFQTQAIETFAKKYSDLDLRGESLEPFEFESLRSNFATSITALKVDASVYGRFNGGMKNLMNAMVNLKTLELLQCGLHSGKYNIEFGKYRFMKLEDAKFVGCVGMKIDFERFIRLCPFLKKLTVRDTGVNPSTVIQAIGKSLPNLTELEILEHSFWPPTDYRVLSQFRSLKVLKLDFGLKPIALLMKNFATNCVPIEHLVICCADINNDAISSISKMKTIKILELIEAKEVNDQNWIHLAKKLPELQELYFDSTFGDEPITIISLKEMLSHANKLSLLRLEYRCLERIQPSYSFSSNDYYTMLKIVRSRPDKVKLLIKMRGFEVNIDVPHAILMKNRDVFWIDAKDNDNSGENEVFIAMASGIFRHFPNVR